MELPAPLARTADAVEDKLFLLRQLTSAGIVRPLPPQKIARMLRALRAFGPTPAAGYTVNAIRRPDRLAIIDDAGRLTFGEVHERTNALARQLRDLGVREGDAVAIMCRNHRGFVESLVAASKLGAHQLLLNTMFSGPQLRDVLDREQPVAVIYDEEFHELLGDGAGRQRVAWADPAVEDPFQNDRPPVAAADPSPDHDPNPQSDNQSDSRASDRALLGHQPRQTTTDSETGPAPRATGVPFAEDLIAAGDSADLTAPGELGRMVILTSGTTGTPKGAARQQPRSLDPVAQILSRMPLKTEQRTMLAAPMFHSWGYLHFTMSFALGSTLVLQRRFTPEGTLAAVAEHRCDVLPVVPVMLQRILDLPDEQLAAYDLSSLKIVALSGSALPGALALRAMDRLGDVLYNLYGSTEVGWATIATPEDLRAAPGTAGKAPRGTAVRIYDDAGRQVTSPGVTGRIFVGNDMRFDGYTGGGGKDAIDGLLASGDVGHFDDEHRLFVDGRDDDMIVSGGENVFPREVEDLLAAHPAVRDVAVLGVVDPQWGEALKAVVVLRAGEALTADEIATHVKANLAGYKVPRQVEFVDELPRNATGKVLKRVLRDDA